MKGILVSLTFEKFGQKMFVDFFFWGGRGEVSFQLKIRTSKAVARKCQWEGFQKKYFQNLRFACFSKGRYAERITFRAYNLNIQETEPVSRREVLTPSLCYDHEVLYYYDVE